VSGLHSEAEAADQPWGEAEVVAVGAAVEADSLASTTGAEEVAAADSSASRTGAEVAGAEDNSASTIGAEVVEVEESAV
jgi:hypothetical protein